MSDDGVGASSDRSQIHSIPHPYESAIAGAAFVCLPKEQALARRRYEVFHRFLTGCSSSIEQVIDSSAGFSGFLDFDRDLPMKVAEEVFSSTLCGLWAKRAISAVADFPDCLDR